MIEVTMHTPPISSGNAISVARFSAPLISSAVSTMVAPTVTT